MDSEGFDADQLHEALSLSQGRGFLSPQPISNQIAHSRDFISLCPQTKHVIDLGAGGGLPSLVWLHLSRDVSITAIDAMKKRTDFLSEMAHRYPSLAERLTVINGRAEEIARDVSMVESTDLVVARGFGPPAVTAECAARFLRIGGHLVVSARPTDEKVRWSEDGLRLLGCVYVETRESEFAHAAVIKKCETTPQEFPRRAKLFSRSPLW